MDNMSNEELFILAKENPDIKEYFFERNNKLFYHVAHKFKNTDFELEDLAQIAAMGMVKAFNSFDVDKGIKFSTYAIRCMQNEITMALRKKRISPISMEEVVRTDGDGKELKIEDTIASESNEFKDVLNNQYALFLVNKLKEEARQKDIEIFYCYINGDNQSNIARKFGLQQGSVSRIIKRVTETLRHLDKVYS